MVLNATPLKQQLAKYLETDAEAIQFCWKGRVGLYGLLKALGIGPGDEVILPAYTCIVVPNAIKYLQATPVYVDIDPRTYNMDTTAIGAKITANTKVIIAQNTYGLSSDIDEIRPFAEAHGLKVLEDCTHGFGGYYKQVQNGKNVDAAFYSSQWNKTFSTGIGGIVVINDPELREKMQEFETELQAPSFKDRTLLQFQLYLRDLLGYSTLYWSALKFYRYLTANNIIVGSSSGEEITGIQMPDGYFTGFSSTQVKRTTYELNRLEQNLEHRRQVAQFYDAVLSKLGLVVPFQPDYATHTFVKYPLLVKDREAVFAEAFKRNIPIHDWFISPLHPIQEGLERWNFQAADFPVASKIAQHVINLPTDLFVNSSMQRRIEQFIIDLKDQFSSFEQLP
ncbi:MAG: aminotransferase class I/II-fold pyridoxal phosphate-dependent enzyme [Bacteroidota bacterium]